MILAKGKLYNSNEQDKILDTLEDEINDTLENKTLLIETVIGAIDRLGRRLAAGEFDSLLSEFGISGFERYKDMAAVMLSRENIEHKIKTELGEYFYLPRLTSPPRGQKRIKIKPMPLGTILHIAAGNVDGLPAYSVAEGLLTGYVNILKLPAADNGLSIEIIRQLTQIEPALADYIYVFDTPSSDIHAMKRMADMSDAISVWGGDEAVAAVRRLAPTSAKIIEWGHKLGFAYISGYSDREKELSALAEHISATRQLLCSSCQTIYIDTESMADIHAFCTEFLPYLQRAVNKYPPMSIGEKAEITLLRYNEIIEKAISGSIDSAQLYRGENCALISCTDSELELSPMFCNCNVKRLPQKDILKVLRRKKGYLQTVGLICREEKRDSLTDALAKCGVVRITRSGDMSETFSGEAHDGEYPLRRYTRIVNIESI